MFFFYSLVLFWNLLPHRLTSSICFFKLHFSNLGLSFAQKWKREVFIHSTNSKIAPPLILPSTNNKRLKEMYTISVCRTHPPMKNIVIDYPFVYQQRKLSHGKIFFRRKSTGNGTRTKQRTSNATRAGFLLR